MPSTAKEPFEPSAPIGRPNVAAAASHARHAAQGRHQPFVAVATTRDLILHVVGRRQVRLDDEHVRRAIAERDGRECHEAAEQHAAADGQDDGEPNLRNREAGAKTCRPAADRAPAIRPR